MKGNYNSDIVSSVDELMFGDGRPERILVFATPISDSGVYNMTIKMMKNGKPDEKKFQELISKYRGDMNQLADFLEDRDYFMTLGRVHDMGSEIRYSSDRKEMKRSARYAAKRGSGIFVMEFVPKDEPVLV